MTTMNEGHLS